MTLSRIDETELLAPLHEGGRETVRFATFLRRLAKRSGADSADLLVGSASLWSPSHARWRPLLLERLRPGRIYALAEMDIASESDALDLSDVRALRVGGSPEAWLIVARRHGEFDAADSALLAGLAVHIMVAVRNVDLMDQARHRAEMAEAGLDRLGIGWISFNADGDITDFDAAADRLIRATGTLGRPQTGTPLTAATAMGRALTDAIRSASTPGDGMPRTLRLSDTPRLDIFLMPHGDTILGLLRDELREPGDSAGHISQLFRLSAKEGLLAEALMHGFTIAEAAESIGLTLETARTYSKRIFSKTGARGQADLVRLLLTSVAGLA